MGSSFSFEASARRMKGFLYVLAATGSIGFGIARGTSWGISFGTGALLAIASFHYTHRFVNSIGTHTERPSNTKAVLVGLRYLFLAAVLYMLVSNVGLNALAALLGLLSPAAAVVLEMIYQLAGQPKPRESKRWAKRFCKWNR